MQLYMYKYACKCTHKLDISIDHRSLHIARSIRLVHAEHTLITVPSPFFSSLALAALAALARYILAHLLLTIVAVLPRSVRARVRGLSSDRLHTGGTGQLLLLVAVLQTSGAQAVIAEHTAAAGPARHGQGGCLANRALHLLSLSRLALPFALPSSFPFALAQQPGHATQHPGLHMAQGPKVEQGQQKEEELAEPMPDQLLIHELKAHLHTVMRQ